MNELKFFDDFSYFKRIAFNKEPSLHEFKHDGETLFFDKCTCHIYEYYINTFGYAYINEKIANVRDIELKKQLKKHIGYCINYKKYCIDELEQFFLDADLEMSYFNELKKLLPFIHRDKAFCKIVHSYVGSRFFNEIVSIFIAYFFSVYIEDDEIQDTWIDYTKILKETFNDNIFDRIITIRTRTNEILDKYGALPIISCNPKRISSDIDNKAFYSLLGTSIHNDEKEPEQIHVGKQTFFKQFMQLFPIYADLIKQDKNIFSDHHNKYNVQFKLYDYLYNNYYQDELNRFKDYLSMLELDILYDDLVTYVPVSNVSISTFIKRNFYVNHVESAFEQYVAVLVVYWIYDMENLTYSNTLYIFNLIKKALKESDNNERLIRLNDKNGVPSYFINTIIQKANKLSDKFNLPLIPTGQEVYEHFKDNGTFELPWENVMFDNGKYYLHHPRHYNNQTLKVVDVKSRISYNSIKLYFANRVPMLKVRANKGIIVEVLDNKNLNLSDYVNSIIQKTSQYKNKIKIEIIHKDTRNNIRSYKPSELRNLTQIEKSYYLNELCKMQLTDHKVYNFVEIRSTSTSFEKEDVFCFIIKETNNTLVLAVENTLESRSTILFYVQKSLFDRALNIINIFFSSNTVNKRQSLLWKDVNFNDVSILRYERVIHSSIHEWNSNIRSLIYYM